MNETMKDDSYIPDLKIHYAIAALLACLLSSHLIFAGDASEQVSAGMEQSAEGSARVISGTLTLASAAVAVPVWMAGSSLEAVGHSTAKGAEQIWDYARHGTHNRPRLNQRINTGGNRNTEEAYVAKKDLSPKEALELSIKEEQ